jgi:L-alanine-DL-glutamate epimerase-like enolase superfamily enzyme
MLVERLEVSAYRVPLDAPESDGTLTWDATTVIAVEAVSGDTRGLGFTYGPVACATLIEEFLSDAVVGRPVEDAPGSWSAMVRSIRNVGRPGVASMAIAAVDVALWDLKARLLGTSLFRLLGAARDRVPVYASGGFTSLSERDLQRQLEGWAEDGFSRAKIKIGTDWGSHIDRDLDRIALARKTLGPEVELFVDANGGYSRKQAIRVGRSLAAEGVTWFEEPVSSDDVDGLREIREAIDVEVAAGEYAYDLFAFARLIPGVDVLQADVSRCAGITEWLRACALAAVHGLQVSGHTAQSLHAHPACTVANLRHLEYFVDHQRADRLLFDGVLDPVGGSLAPDPTRPGLGLELKRSDAERFRVR